MATTEESSFWIARMWRRWRQRVLDERFDADEVMFRNEWNKHDDDPAKQEERQFYIRERLDFDYRRAVEEVGRVAQDAAVTASTVALLLVAAGLYTHPEDLHTSSGRIGSGLLVAVVLIIINSYLPRFFKAWTSKYDGAGEFAVRITSAYLYADQLRRDINVRNRVLQRAKRLLSAAKVLLSVIVVLWFFHQAVH